MRVAVRVDATARIGSGHLMRCLTLADTLRSQQGAEVHFLCRPGAAHLLELVTARGHALHLFDAPDTPHGEPDRLAHADWLGISQAADLAACLPTLQALSPDWLIVDHYAVDRRWQTPARGCGARILVIDDLADRVHDCDILLDQNFYHDATHRYDALTPTRCKRLLGPSHALLRPEFAAARQDAAPRAGDVRRALVFFGSFDPRDLASLGLEALCRTRRPSLAVDLVIGQDHPRAAELAQRCEGLPDVRLHRQVSTMAHLMLAADIAIGAGGSTTLERCYLGLPTLAVDVADNQRAMLHDLHAAGAVVYLGSGGTLTVPVLAAAIDRLIDDAPARERISMRGMALVADGRLDLLKHMTGSPHA